MKFLFVSHATDSHQFFRDPSVRYRCYNPAQDLALLGHVAEVCHIRDVSPELVSRYDVVVFHRPYISRKLVRALKRLSSRKIPALADFDDLIFSEAHIEYSPLLVNNRASKRVVLKKARRYAEALCLFDVATVSTMPLVDEMRRVHPSAEVHVIHNGLSMEWVRHAEQLAVALPERREVGYLPGTSSHDHDMNAIRSSVLGFLSDNSAYGLTVVGPLTFDSGSLNDRFRHEKPVSYYNLPLYLKRFWVTLAPLVDNPFNRCKSAIKYLESAALGVPVLASPIPDMIRFKGMGIQLCESAQDFGVVLDTMRDADFHQSLVDSGRRHVLTQENSMIYTKQWFDMVRGIV